MKSQLLILALLTISGIFLYTQQEQGFLQQSDSQSDLIVLRKQYEQWKHKFNKNTSNNDIQDQLRFSIWLETYEQVQKHNASNSSFKMGMNKFSDISVQEFVQLHMGEKNQEKQKQRNLRVSSDDFTSRNDQEYFKGNVNFTEKMHPVQNQGSCGSCYSFAATATIEGAYAVFKNPVPKLSEQMIVSCSQPYGNNGCHGGFGNSSFDYVMGHGQTTLEKYPYYSGQDGEVNACAVENGQYTLESYTQIVGQGHCLDIQKNGQEQPLYGRVNASTWKQYEKGVFDMCDDLPYDEINHGITIVGFNTESNQAGERYWIIRNSWGPDWGENGYMKLKFGDTCQICHDAYRVYPK